ncbi:MAG: hypothetical protein ACK2UU_06660 [Anaerolineae bacterium]
MLRFNTRMYARWLVIASALVFGVLLVGSCSSVAGPEEANGPGEQASGPTATDDNSGTLIISLETVPIGQAGVFTFTGVPTGTISVGATLVVTDLTPGTYTTTQVNPTPDFDVTAVECDDGDSPSPSSADAVSRTAVLNLDPGETIRCIFTNTQRGALVVTSQVRPDGAVGSFLFTGVPSGTIPAEGTLVASDLTPGTYSTTERDPAPDFDLTAVDCDDGSSATPSSGDAGSRTAVLNLDPGELITCVFTNTRRGTLIVASQVSPDGAEGSFLFTGVPSGTISAGGTLVASNLKPGSYTTTERDPGPDFDLAAVECDDSSSATPSSGDSSTRSAVFNLDPGETIRCLFANALIEAEEPISTAGGAAGEGGISGEGSSGSGAEAPAGINPFDDPGAYLKRFPLPESLPPGAGTFAAPKPGPWSVVHYAGSMACGAMTLDIPASPPESGILEVRDDGQTVIGTGLQEDQSSITMRAAPEIVGRYTGAFEGTEQGVPVTIDHFWQMVTDEHIVGFLTASVTSQGVTCEVYRPYEMTYARQ